MTRPQALERGREGFWWGRLRYTEASLYTRRDTPMLPCAKASMDAILAQLADLG